jgi:outer membrane usher protein
MPRVIQSPTLLPQKQNLKTWIALSKAILIISCIFLTPVYAQGVERVVLKIYLNSEDKGEYILLYTPEGDVLLPREDLENMGLAPLQGGREDYLSLKSLSPEIMFRIDEEGAALHITANPQLFQKSTIDLSSRRPSSVIPLKDNTAFLNYGIRYGLDHDLEFSSLTVPLELGVNLGGPFAFSRFSYRRTKNEEKFIRLLSSLTIDDPARMRRWILGDFSAFSGAPGGGGIFGGVSVSKNFSISPYFTRYPGISLAGVIETPSDVEIYMQDRLVRKEHLSPGEFEFADLPHVTGAGDAVIVIRDPFGREERMIDSFYVSTRLLKPGLHEYSYNLGFRREGLGVKNFEYTDPAFLWSHRYGFSRSLTTGLRGEVNEHVANLGSTFTFVPGNKGEIDTSMAVSRERGRNGYGVLLGYIYSGGMVSGNLAISAHSKDYANLNISASDDKPRFLGLVRFGFHHEDFGSLSFNYSISDMYEGTDIKRTNLSYNRNVFRNTTLNIRVSKIDTEEETTEVFLSLIFQPGRGHTASLNTSVQNSRIAASGTLQKNAPRGVGLGYSLRAGARENLDGNQEIGGYVFTQYRGQYGVYSADYRRSNETNSYFLGAAGGVSFLNGSFYASRPITDSFALVDVHVLEGVKVFQNNQEVGVTNSQGQVLVPELMSYYENSLSIETKDIPINYELGEIEKSVTTSLRGGGVVKFDVKKLQAFTGIFFVAEDGRKTSADYAGLEIKIDGKNIEGIVGKRGEFYLENLPSGRFPARLLLGRQECHFEIVIPDSDDIVVDMGEVTCEVN